MNLSLNMLISFGDARKNSSGKVKESATVKSNLDTWRHDKYYYYCLTFKGLSDLAVAAMGLILEAFKRSFIPFDLFHSITTVGNQFANHRKRNWKFAVKWRNSPLSGKLFLTIGVHKHTCYHFSSLDLGALIPRTWHKPTVAVSKPSLCKKRCCVIHVRVGWSTSMLYRSYFAAIWASQALQDKIWNEINQTHSSYRVYGWLLAY